jgi:transcriptional regulator with XRE-family HTH domain
MPFSETLRELRVKNGMTQKDLGEALKLTQRTITNYETGKNYPPIEGLRKIADFFEVTPDYLMSAQDEFISAAHSKGGTRGRRSARQLVEEVSGLFAGGSISEVDKDAVMRALQEAYWEAKETNKKYTPKRYRKPPLSE